MRRWGLGAGLLLCVVAAQFFWLRRRPDAAAPAPGAATAPVPLTLHLPGRTAARPPSSWLGQPGLRPHRIAGRVTFEGRPVAAATVRLTTEALNIGSWTLAAVATAADGGFDFGPVPAGDYQVRAEAPGHAGVNEEVDLREPHPRHAPDALDLALLPCLMRVRGTVRDASGGVVARARVRALMSGFLFASNTVADDEGRYEVCATPGQVHVEAAADGYGTAVIHGSGRATARIDFALEPEAVLNGTVVDEGGAPVEGALVAAETDGHMPGAITESDGEGKFRFAGLGGDGYVVTAHIDDRAAEEAIELVPAQTAEVTLQLERRALFRGRVTVGGKPEGGATVSVDDGKLRGRDFGSAVTQDDGRFSIAGLPRHLPRVRVKGHKLLGPASLELEGDHEIALACERLARVSGRVVHGGKPVARARVALASYEGERDAFYAADPDGSFSFDGVEPGKVELSARSEEADAVSARRSIEIGVADVTGLTVDLDLAASIAGVVVAKDGAPVAGVTVRATRSDRPDFGSDQTAADGTFTISPLLGGGEYRFWLSSTDPLTGYGAGDDLPTVSVPDGTSRITGMRLVIDVGKLAISGRVTRDKGAAADVRVMARGDHGNTYRLAQTDADGEFTVAGLEQGLYELSFRGQGGAILHSVRDVRAGTRDLEVDFPSGGTIEGTLVGFGEPPVVMSRPSKQDPASQPNLQQGRVAGAGFVISDLSAGEQVVTATGTGGETASATVTVAAGATARLTLTARPVAHVDGRVTHWPDGVPLSGASCTWNAGGRHGTAAVDADAAGRFTMGVPAGKVSIACDLQSANSMNAREVVVDLTAGARATVEVPVLVARQPSRTEWPGVMVDPSRKVLQLRGAALTSGLAVGDVVLAIDGQPVGDLAPMAILLLISDRPPGTSAKITVERAGAERTVELMVEARTRP